MPHLLSYFASTDFSSSIAQIFKAHPLILNYEHLNDSMDNPFHPVIKEHIEYHPDGNVTVHELEIERAYPNTALLSMCLMFGCFFIAYFLRHFKNGHYFPGPVRSTFLVFKQLWSIQNEKSLTVILTTVNALLSVSLDPSHDWRFRCPHCDFLHDCCGHQHWGCLHSGKSCVVVS